MRHLLPAIVGGLLLAAPATAEQPSAMRVQLLNGDFAAAAAQERAADGSPGAAVETFDRGLAAYALKDFAQAAAHFAEVAQGSDPDLAVRAAVAASLALSRSGDREGTCQYTAVVQPLVEDMPLLWRGWIEETRRANRCG